MHAIATVSRTHITTAARAIAVDEGAFEKLMPVYMPKCTTVAMTMAVLTKLARGCADFCADDNAAGTIGLLQSMPFDTFGLSLPMELSMELDFLVSSSQGALGSAALFDAVRKLLRFAQSRTAVVLELGNA